MATAPPEEPASFRPASAFARLAAVSLGVAAALFAVGYLPTLRIAGPDGISAMVVALLIGLIGSWSGTLPTVLALRGGPREHTSGILLGLALRFGITIGLALAAWLTALVAQRPLLLWVAIAQLVFLAADTIGLVALLKRVSKVTA